MKKIIIFTNTDRHFYIHLLPISLKAKIEGYEVKVLTNISEFKDKIEKLAIPVIPIKIAGNTLNPFTDLLLLWNVTKILYKEKPDILHNFTIKPIFYGSISSLFCNIPRTINNFVGMGLIFISNNIIIKFLRLIIVKVIFLITRYRRILFVVQNDEDQALLLKLKVSKQNSVIKQCSVGVDTKKFPALPEPTEKKIIFALVGRITIEKGIYEFIDAAKLLKQKGSNSEFWLVGEADKNDPRSINSSMLAKYQAKGYIKYLGYQKNIEQIWQKAHVAVLPSYREGLSRSLLEAGAYGRSIITTKAPGGTELIEDGVNGLLVAPKNSQDLAAAMELLIANPSLRKSLGAKIRQDILREYDTEKIASKMVELYLDT